MAYWYVTNWGTAINARRFKTKREALAYALTQTGNDLGIAHKKHNCWRLFKLVAGKLELQTVEHDVVRL